MPTLTLDQRRARIALRVTSNAANAAVLEKASRENLRPRIAFERMRKGQFMVRGIPLSSRVYVRIHAEHMLREFKRFDRMYMANEELTKEEQQWLEAEIVRNKAREISTNFAFIALGLRQVRAEMATREQLVATNDKLVATNDKLDEVLNILRTKASPEA